MQQQSRCPNCGSPVMYGQAFCRRCGTSLSSACPYCRTAIGPGVRICPTCGATAGKGTPRQTRWNIPKPASWRPQRAGWWQQYGWAATPASGGRSSSTTYFLLILLTVVVIGLGVFIFTQFSTKPDTSLPTISGVAVVYKGKTSAQIVWQTDKPCSSQVEYGTTMQYGYLEPVIPQNNPSIGKTTGATSHFITITNLRAGRTYHYRVKSKDADGNEAISNNFSFKTDEADPFVMPD